MLEWDAGLRAEGGPEVKGLKAGDSFEMEFTARVRRRLTIQSVAENGVVRFACEPFTVELEGETVQVTPTAPSPLVLGSSHLDISTFQKGRSE